MGRKRHQEEGEEWTVAGDRACTELLELLPRLLSEVVVGTNSVTRGLEKKTIRFVVLPRDTRSSHIPDMAHRDHVPMVVLPTGAFETALSPTLKIKRVSVIGIREKKKTPHEQDTSNNNNNSSDSVPSSSSSLSVALEDLCAWVYRWQSAPTGARRAKLARGNKLQLVNRMT